MNLYVIFFTVMSIFFSFSNCDVNQICAKFDAPEFIADPNDCKSYYKCSNGKALKTSCGNDFWFDSETKWCVDKGSVNCESGAGFEQFINYYKTSTQLPATTTISEFEICYATVQSNLKNACTFNRRGQRVVERKLRRFYEPLKTQLRNCIGIVCKWN